MSRPIGVRSRHCDRDCAGGIGAGRGRMDGVRWGEKGQCRVLTGHHGIGKTTLRPCLTRGLPVARDLPAAHNLATSSPSAGSSARIRACRAAGRRTRSPNAGVADRARGVRRWPGGCHRAGAPRSHGRSGGLPGTAASVCEAPMMAVACHDAGTAFKGKLQFQACLPSSLQGSHCGCFVRDSCDR